MLMRDQHAIEGDAPLALFPDGKRVDLDLRYTV
jgi:hypothetical protein